MIRDIVEIADSGWKPPQLTRRVDGKTHMVFKALIILPKGGLSPHTQFYVGFLAGTVAAG
jgi:hypothetical protein